MATMRSTVFASFNGSGVAPFVVAFFIAAAGVLCLISPTDRTDSHGIPLWLLGGLLVLFAIWLWISAVLTMIRRRRS